MPARRCQAMFSELFNMIAHSHARYIAGSGASHGCGKNNLPALPAFYAGSEKVIKLLSINSIEAELLTLPPQYVVIAKMYCHVSGLSLIVCFFDVQ